LTINQVQAVAGFAGNEETMTINYAVDRLYETGWLPSQEMELERLPNGLRYPTVSAVVREFKEAGLKLSITPHLMFGCCRAEWVAGSSAADELSGTVVGSCEKEAAVYALAKLREQQVDLRLTTVESQLPLATA
jgi:hypothetical protein